MQRHETTAPISVNTEGHSAVAAAPDSDFEVRWAAWQRRGVAHDRAVRRRFVVIATFAGTLASAGAIAYTLLHP